MSVSFIWIFIYHVHAWYPEGQERALDPLELELWVAVCCHASAGTQTRVLHMNNRCS